jgi:hypothetical protein
MRSFRALAAATVLLMGTAVYAQETAGPGRVESSFIPGGGIFFLSTNDGPEFCAYQVGGTIALNVNRFVGFEGELGGALGVTQNLRIGNTVTSQKTPNMVGYSGNVVLSAPVWHRSVPYATAGIGGLTVFRRASLDLAGNETFPTASVGGGLKWYANALWGVRADYRFVGVRSETSQSAFFGQANRFGHRMYAGVIVNLVR